MQSDFDERTYFTLEQIQESLALSIDFFGAGKSGQVADWETIQQMASWLIQHVNDPAWPWLQSEKTHIAEMLEGVLAHPSEHARLPAVRALSVYGNERTYQRLLHRVESGQEGVLYLVQASLETLITLAQALPLEARLISPETLDHLYQTYPTLETLVIELVALARSGPEQ